MPKNIYLFTILSFILSACASAQSSVDNSSYTKALAITQDTAAPPPISNTEGTLIHVKSPSANKKISDGQTVVERANKKALLTANPANTQQAIIIFPYSAGNIYEILTTPLNITDIQLEDNEHVISFGAGDTSRWQISRTTSGEKNSHEEHLIVKPLETDLTTSMIITTNERTYHILLKSTKNTFMAAVQWQYNQHDGLNFTSNPDNNSDLSNNLNPNQLDFSYKTTLLHGNKPSWYPQMVFNDGQKTYLVFPKNNQSAPALFIKKHNSDDIVNYRVIGNKYIVDQVIGNAELSDDDSNTAIQITHSSDV